LGIEHRRLGFAGNLVARAIADGAVEGIFHADSVAIVTSKTGTTLSFQKRGSDHPIGQLHINRRLARHGLTDTAPEGAGKIALTLSTRHGSLRLSRSAQGAPIEHEAQKTNDRLFQRSKAMQARVVPVRRCLKK
jgi:hypothetical protein